MRKILICVCVLLFGSPLIAQSRESADVTKTSLQAGAEFSMFNPDFYCTSGSPFSCGRGDPLIKGIGVFADYNLRGKFGAEGEARWLRWDGLRGQVESTYLIGPRYRALQWHKFSFWAKFLVGVGAITTAGYPGPDTLQGTMFVFAPGAAVDYRLNRKFSVRGDYELQKWPSFAVLPPNTHGLTPNGFSFGVVYTILQ